MTAQFLVFCPSHYPQLHPLPLLPGTSLLSSMIGKIKDTIVAVFFLSTTVINIFNSSLSDCESEFFSHCCWVVHTATVSMLFHKNEHCAQSHCTEVGLFSWSVDALMVTCFWRQSQFCWQSYRLHGRFYSSIRRTHVRCKRKGLSNFTGTSVLITQKKNGSNPSGSLAVL